MAERSSLEPPKEDLTIKFGDHLFIDGDSNRVNAQHRGEVRLTPSEQKDWLNLIAARAAIADSIGAKFAFLLAPDKQTVYRQLLPGSSHHRLAAFLCASPFVVDPAPLLQEMSHHTDLYPITDSHWDHRGAALASSLLLARFGLSHPANLQNWRANVLPGDLGHKRSPPESSERYVAVFYEPSLLLYDNGVGNNGRIRVFSKQNLKISEGECSKLALVFGDSFSYDLVHFLKEAVDIVVQVHSFAFDRSLIEGLKPDILVGEITERFVARPPIPGDGQPLRFIWLDKIFRSERAQILKVSDISTDKLSIRTQEVLEFIRKIYSPYGKHMLDESTVSNQESFSFKNFPLEDILNDESICQHPAMQRVLINGFAKRLPPDQEANFVARFNLERVGLKIPISDRDQVNQLLRKIQFTQLYNDWGYSESISAYENALVLPQTTQSPEHDLVDKKYKGWMVYNGGAYTRDGLIISDALHQGKRGLRHVPDSYCGVPHDAERLPGSWLFGGFYFRHIGHMLTESTGRFWALPQYTDNINGVVFVCYNGAPPSDPSGLDLWLSSNHQAGVRNPSLASIRDYFQLRTDVRLVSRPTLIEHLIVPSQLMGLIPYGELMGAHPTYRKYVRSIADRLPNPDIKYNKIYISRSRFARPNSGLFAEDLLDAWFMAEGYKVVYPEQLSLPDQVALYRHASYIVLSAGSAAHVVALSLTGQQKIFVISRYQNQFDQFTVQLRHFGAAAAFFVDCLCGAFVPKSSEDRVRLNLPSAALIHQLDFTVLWESLRQKNFLSGSQPILDSKDLSVRKQATLEALKAQFDGVEFYLQPLD